tara:strand:- start:586 stop:2280 length:1695 start_codon:yes stop_codon:yes gene_type:complete
MSFYNPITELPTHEVTNQPPPLENYNLFTSDAPLLEAFKRESNNAAQDHLDSVGAELGRAETLDQGRLANEFPPVLKTFNRLGQRIDEVEFHPAYHHMMGLAKEAGMASLPWEKDSKYGHLQHAVIEYMVHQVEAGVCCPQTMTYAGIAALQAQKALTPDLTDFWLPKLISRSYDARMIPADQKTGCTMGMAMTEKQGGSDVRANSTIASPLGKGGPGGEYELTGHKWFCSAPMCDAFLTLAYTEQGLKERKLSCFLVPRFRPDGSRNNFFIQRLKQKLGNWANASSEIEYHNTWAQMVGEEGRGVPTIIEMVHHTRLDTSIAPVSLMRQALSQAIHYCRHRSVFQKKLIDQPLMQNVLADLAVEAEAGTLLFMHLARKFDDSMADMEARRYARLAVAIAKFWHNKRCPNFVYECMECLGGVGYVEENIMPRLYREAPLNSIWEGSGNVICLDILRTFQKEPVALDQYFAEIRPAQGTNAYFDNTLGELKKLLTDTANAERNARRIVEKMALLLQASLVLRHSPAEVSDLFCAARLSQDRHTVYGALPQAADVQKILDRALPGA